jgi:hypothetical protein
MMTRARPRMRREFIPDHLSNEPPNFRLCDAKSLAEW